MRAKFGSDPTAGSKMLSFKFISRLYSVLFQQGIPLQPKAAFQGGLVYVQSKVRVCNCIFNRRQDLTACGISQGSKCVVFW